MLDTLLILFAQAQPPVIVPEATPVWWLVVRDFIAVASVLAVLYFSMKYIRERDKDAKEKDALLYDLIKKNEDADKERRGHLEEFKKDFVKALEDMRNHNMRIVDTLFTLSRETVTTMATLSERMDRLSTTLGHLEDKMNKLPSKGD